MRRLSSNGARSTVFLSPPSHVSRTLLPVRGAAPASRGNGLVPVITASSGETSPPPIGRFSRPAAHVLGIRQRPAALHDEVDAVVEAAAIVALRAVARDRHQADRR